MHMIEALELIDLRETVRGIQAGHLGGEVCGRGSKETGTERYSGLRRQVPDS